MMSPVFDDATVNAIKSLLTNYLLSAAPAMPLPVIDHVTIIALRR